MSNINFELLEKKLNQCKNIKLEDVDIDTVDDLEDINANDNGEKNGNEEYGEFNENNDYKNE